MNQFSLFREPEEKGRAEWQTFNAVKQDTQPGAFRVATPAKKQPSHGVVVPARKYGKPHELFPKFPRPAH